MPSAPLPRSSRAASWPAVAGAIALGALVVAAALHPAARATVQHGLGAVRATGPWVYFAAMAVLPTPLFWFTVPAGELFAAQLTLPGVVAAALGAIAINHALCYWLARYALRPVLERLVRHRGYTVPRLTRENAVSVALLVRLTPGPPLFLQCWLLGIAEMPFGLYLLVSWLCTAPWVVGGVVLGRGVLRGDVTLIAAGAGALGAAFVGVQLWRRRTRPAQTSAPVAVRGE